MGSDNQTEVLKREIKRRGGVKSVAEKLSVSESAVYYWQAGAREPSEELLQYLGLRRVTRLVKAGQP